MEVGWGVENLAESCGERTILRRGDEGFVGFERIPVLERCQ